jgi:hypothetical protein
VAHGVCPSLDFQDTCSSISFERMKFASCASSTVLGILRLYLLTDFADSYSFSRLSLSALLITDTELKLIAAAAKIGLNRIPNFGYRIPAAIGTPSEL